MSLVARAIDVDLGDRAVLRDVSLSIAPHEIVAVAGPNGAGKSTLLRSLAGLIEPRRGAVLLDDLPLSAWERARLARSIAFLPQEGRVHWPLDVRTVVALGRLPHRARFGAVSAEDEAAVATAMAAADVTAFADRPVGTLSGGERARVLLARALAQEARLLIADEPTAGLDPGHALAMFEHFVRLAAEGRSVIVALHDLALAARFCSRMALLKGGRVLALGRPEEVLTRENLAGAYDVEAEVASVGGIPVLVTHGRRPGSG